ncbi:MAG: citrate synthase [Methanobacteriota archaeon]|nr:MAG: citrate synthase [Euryarchaeota archaeon]
MDNGNPQTAKIIIGDKEYELPLVVGTEGEVGINILKFRQMSNGVITYDPGYGNTGSCRSAITFINGEEGILRYRGYNIEDLAEKASFTEVMYLVIFGELPTKSQLEEFEADLRENAMIHEDMKKFFEGFPATAHPMAILSSMITALSTFHPPSGNSDHDHRDDIIKLLAKVKTIAAYSYKKSIGEPYIYPDPKLGYVGDFLNMMFKKSPTHDYKVNPVVEKALNQLLILHADHEQNCSASTVRMVGSSKGNMYSAIAAGVSALWGPLHGGANQAVIEMLEAIQRDGGDIEKYVNMAKDKSSGFRLMGFGHRVYKNFDPRARILKKAADNILNELGVEDPLLDIAKKLEEVALNDEYFKTRKLYPNVDFYSGIIYRALGIPKNMFTVMFALGRLPGWIAQWKEMREDPEFRIHRPRQIYIGPTERKFVPIEERS